MVMFLCALSYNIMAKYSTCCHNFKQSKQPRETGTWEIPFKHGDWLNGLSIIIGWVGLFGRRRKHVSDDWMSLSVWLGLTSFPARPWRWERVVSCHTGRELQLPLCVFQVHFLALGASANVGTWEVSDFFSSERFDSQQSLHWEDRHESKDEQPILWRSLVG